MNFGRSITSYHLITTWRSSWATSEQGKNLKNFKTFLSELCLLFLSLFSYQSSLDFGENGENFITCFSTFHAVSFKVLVFGHFTKWKMVDNCCGLEHSQDVYFYESLKKISNFIFNSDSVIFLLLFVVSAFVLCYSSFHRAPLHPANQVSLITFFLQATC